MFDSAFKRPLVAPAVAVAVALLMATLDPAIASANIPPPPNQQPFDEVRLRNGGFVRGTVTELAPGTYVVLDARNGSRRFDWKDVEAVVLSDGTVHTKDAIPTGALPKPEPKPEPKPDPGVEPKPDPGVEPKPDPSVEPDPEPEPEPEPKFDPDELAEPKPEPTGTGPTVVVEVNNDKGAPVELRQVEGAGGQGNAKIDPSSGSVICTTPCNLALPTGDGEYFATVDGKQVGRSFRLFADSTVKVTRKDPIKFWSGVALIPATVLIGVGIGIIPALHNVPQQKVAGYAAGGAVIGLLGIGGGVTLIMFSRSKVKVLPGIQGGE